MAAQEEYYRAVTKCLPLFRGESVLFAPLYIENGDDSDFYLLGEELGCKDGTVQCSFKSEIFANYPEMLIKLIGRGRRLTEDGDFIENSWYERMSEDEEGEKDLALMAFCLDNATHSLQETEREVNALFITRFRDHCIRWWLVRPDAVKRVVIPLLLRSLEDGVTRAIASEMVQSSEKGAMKGVRIPPILSALEDDVIRAIATVVIQSSETSCMRQRQHFERQINSGGFTDGYPSSGDHAVMLSQNGSNGTATEAHLHDALEDPS